MYQLEDVHSIPLVRYSKCFLLWFRQYYFSSDNSNSKVKILMKSRFQFSRSSSTKSGCLEPPRQPSNISLHYGDKICEIFLAIYWALYLYTLGMSNDSMKQVKNTSLKAILYRLDVDVAFGGFGSIKQLHWVCKSNA